MPPWRNSQTSPAPGTSTPSPSFEPPSLTTRKQSLGCWRHQGHPAGAVAPGIAPWLHGHDVQAAPLSQAERQGTGRSTGSPPCLHSTAAGQTDGMSGKHGAGSLVSPATRGGPEPALYQFYSSQVSRRSGDATSLQFCPAQHGSRALPSPLPLQLPQAGDRLWALLGCPGREKA